MVSITVGESLSFGSLAVGAWHHIACSVNGVSGKITAYIDGHQVGQYSHVPFVGYYPYFNPISSVFIGADNCAQFFLGTSPRFTGFIDDVSLYSYVVTAQNVQDIYAKGVSTHTDIASK
jgi:hypothetical protein